MVQDLFPMNRMDDVLNFNPGLDINQSIEKGKLRQYKKLTEYSSEIQNNNNVHGILQDYFFHFLTAISTLLDTILAIDNLIVYDGHSTAIPHFSVETIDGMKPIDFPPP